MTNQYRLEVESPQEVIIQILIDQSLENKFGLMVTLWKNLPEKTSNYTHKEFQRHRKQTKGDEPLPIFPPGMNTKFVYKIPPGTIHNSYLFNLDEGVYTVVVCAAPQIAIPEPTRFVFQAIAENIQLTQLE